MRPLLSVAPVVRPLPRSLTLWARINLDIPNHAGGLAGQPAVAQRLWKLAETHTPQVRVTHYTQAIMDLGASCAPALCAGSREGSGGMESRPVLWYKDTDPRPLGLAALVAKLMKNLKGRSSAEEHIE